MKILITGSAGFMGSHLYDRLFSQHSVYGIDDLSGGNLKNVLKKDFFTKLDLRNREETEKYINELKPEIIFHFAADATEGRSQFTPFSALDRNLAAYMNLLIPAIKNNLKKIIMISSMSVYGGQQTPFNETMIPQPEDVYGSMKSAMETVTKVMANVYGFKYTIIRPHNVYGPRQNMSDPYRNVIGIFINCLLNKKNFYIYGDGKQKRAFSYIDDVNEAIAKAAFNKKCEGKTINIGGEEVITLNDLGKMVLKIFFKNKPIPKNFRPLHLSARPQEVKYAYCNHDLAKKTLNFKPKTPLEHGLKNMIDWAKLNGPQSCNYLEKFDLDHKLIPKTWTKKLL